MNQATKSDMMNCIDRIRKTSNIVDGGALYGFMAALVVDDRTAAPLAIVGWPLLLGLTLPRGDAASAGSVLDRVAPVGLPKEPLFDAMDKSGEGFVTKEEAVAYLKANPQVLSCSTKTALLERFKNALVVDMTGKTDSAALY